MRIRLFIAAALVSLIALLAPAPPKTTAAGTDCNLVAQICGDMAEMKYNCCILSGSSASDCAWFEAQYKIDCMRNNGCQPGGN